MEANGAQVRRIGVLTGGGDCPGLNAVIRAVVKDALYHGMEVYGIADGFLGLIERRTRKLDEHDVANIITAGGTILGSSNKANPARFATGTNPDGSPTFRDVTDDCVAYAKDLGLDAIVCIGGDGTMSAAASFCAKGVNCIGVPKTIDNDLEGTDITFGFMTAVETATEAIDRVRTTAASHHRAMVVEVMGRNAGWIALHSGLASGADIILLPELDFGVEEVCAAINRRRARGKRFSIICVAEGAKPAGGEQVVKQIDPTSPDPIRLGGIAAWLSDRIQQDTGIESRHVVLGHLQRGGTPVAMDRVLATQFGHHAMHLLKTGAQNRMVAMQSFRLTDVPIEHVAGKQRTISAEEPLLTTARSVGVRFCVPAPQPVES
ncbi:MAG: ATP-dependent 6-phosphofructokinase [Planctomycetota bacterium]